MGILLQAKRNFILTFILITCGIVQANAQDKAQTLHDLNKLLVNTVMVDFFTPPVASRIYSYPNIAFYECIRQQEPGTYPDFVGKLNGLKSLPLADNKTDLFIAGCISFSYVAQSLVGSEYKLEDWRNSFLDSIQNTTDHELITTSVKYGRLVADSILSWVKKDNYNESRGMPRFTFSNKTGTWKPTPADYAPAIEPHWNKLRPYTLTSCAQFSPKSKLRYNMDTASTFYKSMMEVYHIVKNLDTVQKKIALYWDDNPNVSVNLGHLNYFIHKISPGGHWMMIAQQACVKNNAPVAKSSLAYALTGIALFDAFISCWDEKYKTDLIRPITVINDYIDKNWQPYIQTPPFPEFTSGHAVISNSAATVLTALFGDRYAFTDETEIPFGNDTRHFNSFYDAAEEVTWSRVYGGIHYPETARVSIVQGREVGNHVLHLLYPALAKK